MTKHLVRTLGIMTVASLFVFTACDDDSPTDPGSVPAQVTLTPAEMTFTAVGDTARFTVAVHNAAGEFLPDAPVTWVSSDTGIATVDTAGLVTATGFGVAMITATSGEAEGTADVTVTDLSAPAEVLVTPQDVTLTAVGETAQLVVEVLDGEGNTITDPTVSWASSDEAVATVDANGLVTAVGAGTTTVTATSGDASGTVEVTVTL